VTPCLVECAPAGARLSPSGFADLAWRSVPYA
jgi:hypothetical protein